MCNELKVLNVKNWKELALGMVWLRSQNSQRVFNLLEEEEEEEEEEGGGEIKGGGEEVGGGEEEEEEEG